jgi:hypothetical protein
LHFSHTFFEKKNMRELWCLLLLLLSRIAKALFRTYTESESPTSVEPEVCKGETEMKENIPLESIFKYRRSRKK